MSARALPLKPIIKINLLNDSQVSEIVSKYFLLYFFQVYLLLRTLLLLLLQFSRQRQRLLCILPLVKFFWPLGPCPLRTTPPLPRSTWTTLPTTPVHLAHPTPLASSLPPPPWPAREGWCECQACPTPVMESKTSLMQCRDTSMQLKRRWCMRPCMRRTRPGHFLRSPKNGCVSKVSEAESRRGFSSEQQSDWTVQWRRCPCDAPPSGERALGAVLGPGPAVGTH